MNIIKFESLLPWKFFLKDEVVSRGGGLFVTLF